MPVTRTQVDLKRTPIHEHLLDTNTGVRATAHQVGARRMVDTKVATEASINTVHHPEKMLVENDNGQSIIPPSNELLNSGQHSEDATTGEQGQNIAEMMIKSSKYGQQDTPKGLLFSGRHTEESGQWLDHIFEIIEQGDFSPIEQRDIAAARLTGEARLWYRLNRLKMPDMQSFIHHFLLSYNPAKRQASEELMMENEEEQMYMDVSKNIQEQQQVLEPSFQWGASAKVLQSARNEKVKLFPNFSGTENSLYWLKSLQQLGKALRLEDKQIYELATIKLSGPAQEWFYHQDEKMDDWASFKQAFLHAFPPPIQPTNIDYLAQLLARQQGETEPVGKYVQDMNRLCLKLDEKINEKDKLQFLRRGLRPQLQHHALAITSVEDFLTILQRHEQIEKQSIANYPSSFKAAMRPSQQQYSSSHQYQSMDPDYRQDRASRGYRSSERNPRQDSNGDLTSQRLEKENRVCYQCNKRGHLQWNCPDRNMSAQQYQPYRQQQQSHQQPYEQQQYEPTQQQQQQQQHFQ